MQLMKLWWQIYLHLIPFNDNDVVNGHANISGTSVFTSSGSYLEPSSTKEGVLLEFQFEKCFG